MWKEESVSIQTQLIWNAQNLYKIRPSNNTNFINYFVLILRMFTLQKSCYSGGESEWSKLYVVGLVVDVRELSVPAEIIIK